MERKKIFSAKISLWGKINRAIFSRKRNQGFALLYVLGALLITTFVGAALLNLSHHDIISATDYSAMATAAISARSAMQAAVAKIEQLSPDVVTILNNHIDDGYSGSDKDWLLGLSGSPITLNSQQKYDVKILGFDRTNYTVQIEGTGWGKGGSMKKVVGIFKLDGIEFQTISNLGSSHSIYAGPNAAYTFNSSIDVYGNAYFGHEPIFFADASGTTFHGQYRTLKDWSKISKFHGIYTFMQEAYFGTDIEVSAKTGQPNNHLIDCKMKAGIGGEIIGSGDFDFEFYDDMYFNDDVSAGWTVVLDFNNNTLYHNNEVDYTSGSAEGTFQNFTPSYHSNPIDILSELGMPTATPQEVGVDISVIDKKYLWSNINDKAGYLSGENLDGKKANLLYTYAEGGGGGIGLWEDFLVIEANSNITLMRGATDEAFDKKMILIINNGVTVQPIGSGPYVGTSYDSEPDVAITMIYIKSGGALQNFGGWSNLFRGYIHCASGGVINMGGALNTVGNIEGAIHNHSSGGFGWYPDPANSDIIFNGDVMNGLGAVGVVTPVGGGSVTVTNTLILTAENITTTLLGMYF